MIEDSINHAEQTRKEADLLLADYRQRLTEARSQADDIVARARKAADQREADALEAGRKEREELLEQTRNEIQLETEKSLQDLRREVASLTVARNREGHPQVARLRTTSSVWSRKRSARSTSSALTGGRVATTKAD